MKFLLPGLSQRGRWNMPKNKRKPLKKDFVPSKSSSRELVFYVYDQDKKENVYRSYYLDDCVLLKREKNEEVPERYKVRQGYILIKSNS